MTTQSGGLSGLLATSGIFFNAFQRYSKDEGWTQTATDAKNGYLWQYDTSKDLYIRVQISPTNVKRYSFQGSNSGGYYNPTDAFTEGIESTIVRWDRDEIEFFILRGQSVGTWSISSPYSITIPLTLLPEGTCESIGKTFEPPVNDSTNNIESTIKIRPVEPYSLKPEQPSLTYGNGGSGSISMDAVWNDAEKAST